MSEPIISRMRERAGRLRRLAGLAHDPLMIEMLIRTAGEIEADADRLEKALDAGTGAKQWTSASAHLRRPLNPKHFSVHLPPIAEISSW